MPQNNPMTELLDFIKSSNITPQQAQEKVQSLGEQTDIVQNLFDWQNKKLIDGAAHVKTLIDMYKYLKFLGRIM